MKMNRVFILLLITIILVGCTENLNQTTGEDNQVEDTINSEEQSSNENKEELSYEEIVLEEIDSRDDLEIVEDLDICEAEEVYCFKYNKLNIGSQDIIVKIEMDNKQKELYDLILAYELPDDGIIEVESSKYGVILYDNGYRFYRESKMLHSAPGHSTDLVKPTEAQSFGLVIHLVHFHGARSKENIHNNTYILEGLNELKEFAQHDVVLSWIDDSIEILEKVVVEDIPDEKLIEEAWKQLNYFGDVIEVYLYENGLL